ncbi:MAG TPA: hypothetical protein EYN66_09575 [Myxococcales bacterium]|nr:hypothetical protein [Myxococcales bacterium]
MIFGSELGVAPSLFRIGRLFYPTDEAYGHQAIIAAPTEPAMILDGWPGASTLGGMTTQRVQFLKRLLNLMGILFILAMAFKVGPFGSKTAIFLGIACFIVGNALPKLLNPPEDKS